MKGARVGASLLTARNWQPVRTEPGGMEQEGGRSGKFEDCSSVVIGACIEVHRVLGPGLLESAYEACLAHELTLRRLSSKASESLAC